MTASTSAFLPASSPAPSGAINRQNPELAERFALFDLFAAKIPRIAINKVRFAIGYGDSGERPLPDLGTPLDNPLNPSQPGHFDQPSQLRMEFA